MRYRGVRRSLVHPRLTPGVRRGFTLVELVTALAILGVIATVATVSVASLRAPSSHRVVERLDATRRAAIMTGTPTRVSGDSACVVLFLPDGSALGARCTIDSVTLTVDQLTGTARASH